MRSMTGRAETSIEVVDYRRSAALPGVEVIDAQRSPRQWRVMCPDYAVVMFRTWRGGVHSRGRLHSGEPGLVFCNTPGEVMIANPHQAPGSFSVLELRSDVLLQWLAEQQPSSVRLDWAGVMQPISSALRRRFCDFFEVFEATASAMQVQSQLLELSELLLSELILGARQPRPSVVPPLRAAARMRECLNEEGLHVDLETLAKRAGLSRFQALRAFKQRYGLPPHAYQLCLRVGHARRLLLEGAPAAEVAARCGFADQSHFTRHFKRLNGVTPMQYARAHRPVSRRANDDYRGVDSPSAIVTRSDR
jgi:AraC-like DNA-binding protein